MSFEVLENDLSQIDEKNEKIARIAHYAKEVTGADRCSLFVFEAAKDQLRSIYNDGIKGSIVLNSNYGIVGYAFHKKKAVLENNTAQSTIFFKAVDQKSGYHTKSVLAVPLINVHNERIGVIQLLNKAPGFNDEDLKNVEHLARLLLPILDPESLEDGSKKQDDEPPLSILQKKFDTYLEDKRLFLMEDGCAYYKILEMKRDYFIGADKCYLLEEEAKEVQLFYFTITDEFLSIDATAKIDENLNGVLVHDTGNPQTFVCYPLETD